MIVTYPTIVRPVFAWARALVPLARPRLFFLETDLSLEDKPIYMVLSAWLEASQMVNFLDYSLFIVLRPFYHTLGQLLNRHKPAHIFTRPAFYPLDKVIFRRFQPWVPRQVYTKQAPSASENSTELLHSLCSQTTRSEVYMCKLFVFLDKFSNLRGDILRYLVPWKVKVSQSPILS